MKKFISVMLILSLCLTTVNGNAYENLDSNSTSNVTDVVESLENCKEQSQNLSIERPLSVTDSEATQDAAQLLSGTTMNTQGLKEENEDSSSIGAEHVMQGDDVESFVSGAVNNHEPDVTLDELAVFVADMFTRHGNGSKEDRWLSSADNARSLLVLMERMDEFQNGLLTVRAFYNFVSAGGTLDVSDLLMSLRSAWGMIRCLWHMGRLPIDKVGVKTVWTLEDRLFRDYYNK